MADEVSPEVIQSTQKLLGKHVTKPQLTEKLLRKPPFRFLHDVIVVLVRSGFLKGLYTDAELNSENVKDRDAKIAFLNKLITAVKTLSGKELQVKANKIIAGLDATETNRLLQTIAKLIDNKVDTKEYVKSLKKPSNDTKRLGDAQDSARDGSNSKKTTNKTSAIKSTDKLDSSRKSTERKAVRKGSDAASPKVKGSTTSKAKVDPKKKTLKSEAGEKTSSKTSVSSKDSKTSKASKTNSTKVSPKEKTTPKVTSAKDVNQLQDKVEDSPGQQVDAGEPESQVAKLTAEPEGSPREDSWKPQVIGADREDRSYDHEAVDKSSTARQPSARPKSARPRSGSNDQRAPSAQVQNDAQLEVSAVPARGIPSASNKKPVMSMKSASKEGRASSTNITGTTDGKNTPGADVTGAEETEEKQRATPCRPKSSLLRPPSVRPSSARPGAPRLRPDSAIPMKELIPLGKISVIVENFDAVDTANEEDEEETVVIQSVPEEPPPESNFTEKSLNLDIPADKGHLVEQILEQIQDGGQGEKAQLEWEHEGAKGKDATTKEITALRASIQALTKTANPLGKLASYLHEDVEAMHSELQTWLGMKQQYTAEIAKQKRVNNESNQPLLQQLHNLEESIKHERVEIASIKYNILRNEERIRYLVSKQIVIE